MASAFTPPVTIHDYARNDPMDTLFLPEQSLDLTQRGVRLRGRAMIERRKHPRFKINVPVEIHSENSNAPLHCATSDLSLDGCYIESMYPFPAGTRLRT